MATARIEKFGEPVIEWTVKLTKSKPSNGSSQDENAPEGNLFSGWWSYVIEGSSLVEEGRKLKYSVDGYLSAPEAQNAAISKMEAMTTDYRIYLSAGGSSFKVLL
jgi:hypothetical protein